MERRFLIPDYLFEVSWEVCNKVGGIHTVISTKAKSIKEEIGDGHILIGPDVWRDSDENPEFEEDPNLFPDWKQKALQEGLRVKVGRWSISGNPIAIILDFTPFMSKKDQIFSKLWEYYKLDSMSGQWDYIEPTLFGYAAGNLIQSFIRHNLNPRTKIVAQFHEWMTGAGLLYLKEFTPQVATVFTTHATVIGRSIAGNQLPLYSQLTVYDGDAKSNDFNVVSKQSLEKLSARNADSFTTVSEITARECTQFLKKDVDVITPNGFEDSFVPQGDEFDKKRHEAQERLRAVSKAILGDSLADDALFFATSGRYEFRNKGLDVFIEAMGELNKKELTREVIAFLLIPAHHYGPRKDLVEALNSGQMLHDNTSSCLTHYLHNPEYDPILQCLSNNGLFNKPGQKVKVIFIPSYLQGDDGIFNKSYYDLLIGFDITVFPSYYEPWGYTPLESLAFRIPTITTSLAGFGIWVERNFEEPGNGITVIERNDENTGETITGICGALEKFTRLNKEETEKARAKAFDISRIALWNNLIEYYRMAYDAALHLAVHRTNLYFDTDRPEYLADKISSERPDWKKFVVEEHIPSRLMPLEEISRNLWWSWSKKAIDLFRSMDKTLWNESNQNPIQLLQKISLDQLEKLENDDEFIGRMSAVEEDFKAYLADKKDIKGPKVAYFSMEFGLHDSLKIYSGGLGLLAGDYLKEASDYNRDIVGIGLLYRYGYFTQVVSAGGEQIAASVPQDFSITPVMPVRDEMGNWKTISIKLPGRLLKARIWKVEVGRVELYMLDTDFEENMEQDRSITHHLYGGDNDYRFRQEFLLGVGGIRALNDLGIMPDLYHCNEGHAAFIGLERLNNIIREYNMTFQEASEIVRASTLFTTHTPVPAGHDTFDEDLLRVYMSHYADRLKISWDQFVGLGRLNPDNQNEKFSMSHLAIKLSQEVNGVSKLHGRVSQEMFNELWPGYTADELHIGYVTNGVHVPTWLSEAWLDLYQSEIDEDFLSKQDDRKMWSKFNKINDATIWNVRSAQRERLVTYIKERLRTAYISRYENPKIISEVEENLRPDVLTVGFARRFATYKRAHLLFRDLERLSGIVNDPEKPVQFLFAGKAHPNDKAGQDLIKRIVEIAKMPEFLGKVIFLQNYDIALAQQLIRGVDIWLNTPTRPLEASGTSGEKVVMNGGLHLSVLDGWWAEGYRPGAGWALPEEKSYDNQEFQDELDAETIYALFENEITAKFYSRNKAGIPVDWIRIIKKSVAEVAPEFTMNRMLIDYENKFYQPLFERTKKIKSEDYQLAKDISLWKKHMTRSWNKIRVISYTHPDISREAVTLGQPYESQVVLDLNGLLTEEIGVELVIREFDADDQWTTESLAQELMPGTPENGRVTYTCKVTPPKPGVFKYGIRIFPKNPVLPHRQDFALVKWI
jgi:phosphorylase/glycogen(starch) synthase